MNFACIRTFIEHDLWHIRLAQEPRNRRLWIKPLRIVILTVREFQKDKCALRASALTFYTLMSIVPVLALAFGIAKGFGMDERLETEIRRGVTGLVESGGSPRAAAPQDAAAMGQDGVVADVTGSATPEANVGQIAEVVEQAIGFATNLLEQTRGGVIAGFGVIFLLWTVIKLLSNIELSLNDVWLVKQPRSWPRRFSDYLSVMIVAPILFIVSVSAKGFVAAAVNAEDGSWLIGLISGPVLLSLKFAPFFFITLLMTFLYIFMPNGKIRLASAFIGGLFAAILFNLLLQAYVQFQIGASQAGAIYGSFAALPLFLTLVQLSWMVVLLGAELAFAHQFGDLSEFDQDAKRASPHFIKLTALSIVRECVAPFAKGEPPPRAEQLAERTGVPYQVVAEVVNRLVEAEVLSEVVLRRGRGVAYQPALDIEGLRVSDVLDRIERTGVDSIPCGDSKIRAELAKSVEAFAAAAENLDANKRLRDLV